MCESSSRESQGAGHTQHIEDSAVEAYLCSAYVYHIQGISSIVLILSA